MVLQLLALGGLGPEQGAAGVQQVGPLVVELFVDKEDSCSGPTVVTTRLAAVSPNSRSSRSDCFDKASMDRSRGVFLSSTSPL